MLASFNLLERNDKPAGPAACTRFKHCQSIRETCGVFLSLKFTEVGPSSMISNGEVDGSSPCIREEARCCRSADPSGPHQPPGNQAHDTKVVHQIACSKSVCRQKKR